jgi:predicted nuclease of predicted toxin-antitoxin system
VKIVTDKDLGTDRIVCLPLGGHEVVHWSAVGAQDDDDASIMRWAAANETVVLTADLDFGTLLAASKAPWPSDVQLRTPNTPACYSGALVLEALRQASYYIETGALVTVEATRFRVRPLPN